jgi:hypothetical protein
VSATPNEGEIVFRVIVVILDVAHRLPSVGLVFVKANFKDADLGDGTTSPAVLLVNLYTAASIMRLRCGRRWKKKMNKDTAIPRAIASSRAQ